MKTIRRALTLSVLAFGQAFADDLTETNIDFDGLPDLIQFECVPEPKAANRFLNLFERRISIPKNFASSGSDPNWLNWDVRIVGEEGDSLVFPFAAIQYGELDTDIDWILDEFTRVSEAAENGFGVDVYLRTPQPADFAKDHWLIILNDEKFLKVIARAEIDWNSLLACFQ